MTRKNTILPKVAVITRTKNRNLLLSRAIKSVDMQTYENYVHVILNDGGDKKTLDNTLKGFNGKKRIVIHNSQSVGLVKALNQAIRAVDSEYIAILDDDDTWSRDRLTSAINYLDSTKDCAVAIKMGLILEEINDDGSINIISKSLHPESGEGEISIYKQCYQNYLSNAVITYSRAVYNEIGGYDETLEAAEDWDFGIKLLRRYDVGFLRTEKPLCFYHQRPNSQVGFGNSVYDGGIQEKMINIIRNRYLRNDINEGKLGIGYIMNDIPYRISLVTRLEGHINYVSTNGIQKITEKIDSMSFYKKIKRKIKNI